MGYFKKKYPQKEGEKREGGNKFLKASDFMGEGQELKFVGVAAVPANKIDFGANELDWLFKEDHLEQGETFEYTFMDSNKEEKVFTSKSAVFFISFRNEDPDLGDKLKIVRTGEGRETKYEVRILAKAMPKGGESNGM